MSAFSPIFLSFFLFSFLRQGHSLYIVLAVLGFTLHQAGLNSETTCPCLLGAGIKGVCLPVGLCCPFGVFWVSLALCAVSAQHPVCETHYQAQRRRGDFCLWDS